MTQQIKMSIQEVINTAFIPNAETGEIDISIGLRLDTRDFNTSLLRNIIRHYAEQKHLPIANHFNAKVYEVNEIILTDDIHDVELTPTLANSISAEVLDGLIKRQSKQHMLINMFHRNLLSKDLTKTSITTIEMYGYMAAYVILS